MLMETQLCFHYISFLNIWFLFCCFSTCRTICTVSVNANLKEWIKLWFFIVLFAQSSTVLRQSLRKVFAVCHETPYEDLWKNNVRLCHPHVPTSFVGKLAKEEDVLQVTTSSSWQKVLSNQCFQTFTTTEVLPAPYTLLSPSLCPVHWVAVPCRSSYGNDCTLEGIAQTPHHESAREGMGRFG